MLPPSSRPLWGLLKGSQGEAVGLQTCPVYSPPSSRARPPGHPHLIGRPDTCVGLWALLKKVEPHSDQNYNKDQHQCRAKVPLTPSSQSPQEERCPAVQSPPAVRPCPRCHDPDDLPCVAATRSAGQPRKGAEDQVALLWERGFSNLRGETPTIPRPAPGYLPLSSEECGSQRWVVGCVLRRAPGQVDRPRPSSLGKGEATENPAQLSLHNLCSAPEPGIRTPQRAAAQ